MARKPRKPRKPAPAGRRRHHVITNKDFIPADPPADPTLVYLQVSVSPALRERIRNRAAKESRSLNVMTRLLLEEAVKPRREARTPDRSRGQASDHSRGQA